MTITTARPTRRTLVRGAAWSVPVVSIAAVAPAFAASIKGAAVLSAGIADKWGKDAQDYWHVSWDLKLVNGAKIIDFVSITITYAPTMTNRGFDSAAIRDYNPSLPNAWSVTVNPVTTAGQYTVTATRQANIAAGATTFIHADFKGLNSNSAGAIGATGLVTYTDGTTSPLTVATADWKPGNEHPASH
ncbi:MAG: hypothetical protein ABIR39_07500 [Nocardioides sp.]|uniref:hypothetical protein n=1 Tax=Nocardioides sp. TaxID=35761 RepID=UPI00326312A0